MFETDKTASIDEGPVWLYQVFRSGDRGNPVAHCETREAAELVVAALNLRESLSTRRKWRRRVSPRPAKAEASDWHSQTIREPELTLPPRQSA